MAQELWLESDHNSVGFVADIGGTNSRFCLVARDKKNNPVLGPVTIMPTGQFPSFAACATSWLENIPTTLRPTAACLALAGPIDKEGCVTLTNHQDWSFRIDKLQKHLSLDYLKVINDFAAIGHALPLLDKVNLHVIRHGPDWPETLPQSVTFLGPGTGLGVGFLISQKGRHQVVATEGGHISFAPQNEVEMDILRSLATKYGHVSAERLISGPGLENIHRCLSNTNKHLKPADIVAAAIASNNGLCHTTVKLFVMMLASLAGNLALSHGSEAVAIAGGIAPRLLKFIDHPAFRHSFEAKGRLKGLMSKIPMAVVTHHDPGLLGAAKCLIDQ